MPINGLTWLFIFNQPLLAGDLGWSNRMFLISGRSFCIEYSNLAAKVLLQTILPLFEVT